MDHNALYIQAYDKILVQLLVLTKNDVDLSKDLRHDVFERMNESIRQGKEFDSEKGFVRWLKRITFNLYVDYYRKGQRSVVSRMNIVPQVLFISNGERSVEEELIHQELVQQAVSGIDSLHDHWKETYHLHVLDELKFRQISEVTGRSIMTVLGEMRYARKKLKNEIFK